MINQEKELKMQRQWSQRNRKRSVEQVRTNRNNGHHLPPTWRNVAADPSAGPKQPAFGNMSEGPPRPPTASKIPKRSESTRVKAASRARSKTNPEKLASVVGTSNQQRTVKSMESPRKEAAGLDGMVSRDSGSHSKHMTRRTSMDRVF